MIPNYDDFTSKAKQGAVDESMGGFLEGRIAELREFVRGIPASMPSAAKVNVKELESAIDDLQKRFKKVLSGTGLLGW